MSSSHRRVSRRAFVQAGAAGALTASAYAQVPGANERIGVGFIGYGLIGKRHVLDFRAEKDVRMIALAEAHERRLNEGLGEMGQGAQGYRDFRRLLERKDIGAVVISTPDHLANISLRLGKKLRWNAEREEIVGDAEANRWLVRPYRAPWDRELKALGVGG